MESTKSFRTKPFQVNQHLECVIEVNPDAEQLARNADEERSSRGIKGPLHGIPVLVKDVGLPILLCNVA